MPVLFTPITKRTRTETVMMIPWIIIAVATPLIPPVRAAIITRAVKIARPIL